MATTQRERYRQALTALEHARQQATRDEMLYQISLNRLRDADIEGFESEADQFEERSAELETTLARDQQQLAALEGETEELRLLATVEEIDEVATIYDAALLRLIAAAERLTTDMAEVATIAARATALAGELPPRFAVSHRTAAAASEQAQALDQAMKRLLATATRVDLPPASQDERPAGTSV